ncbi:hypothetical protein EOPP23_16705 [Endozoicomonas sp. OPT23]|uniref:type II secretion system minor pseudopilin GspK n=1 Tax=Endozoicomonas sp. OPT23 TaxID=2072845 RepID=UPI00129B5890|nr:type II secretion system minor pseudopilin GspK [Endozoicomonas sp. OPT23]MRI34625.1 hypothetical protein [Endozoicomonas sp. OPT23]
MNLKKNQSGIALIYVLLIFAIITLMASQMVTSLWLHTEKNSRYLERVQARHLALGAEQYVALLLEQDAEEDKKKKKLVDHEKERWNVTEVAYPVEQGEIELRIVDENSLFNLNWLSAKALDAKRFDRMFDQLLKNQGIDSGVKDSIKDWLDSDQEALENGAEDNYYLSMDPAYRTADTAIASLTELKLIKGIGLEEYEQLLPLLTSIPGSSRININTALPDVLRTISDNLSEGDVVSIIDSRGSEVFSKIDDLAKLPALKEKTADLKSAPLGVVSNFFTVFIKARYRDTTFYLRTQLFRNAEGQVQVAGREIGPNDYWVVAKKES